jgi:hypothetical protein
MPLSNMMPAPLLRSPATRHGGAFAFALAACIASAAGAQPTDADFIAARDAYRAGDSGRLEARATSKGHLLEPYVAYWQLNSSSTTPIRGRADFSRGTPIFR